MKQFRIRVLTPLEGFKWIVGIAAPEDENAMRSIVEDMTNHLNNHLALGIGTDMGVVIVPPDILAKCLIIVEILEETAK